MFRQIDKINTWGYIEDVAAFGKGLGDKNYLNWRGNTNAITIYVLYSPTL